MGSLLGCALSRRGVRETQRAGEEPSKLWSQLEPSFSLIPRSKASPSLSQGGQPFVHPQPQTRARQSLVDSPWCDLVERVVPFQLRAIPWRRAAVIHGQQILAVLGGWVRVSICLVKGTWQGTNSIHHNCPNYKSSLQSRTN